MRSRAAGSVSASSSSIIALLVGSMPRNRVNSRPSSALVPTMSGTRCAWPPRIASMGSTGRYSSPTTGPIGKAPSLCCMPCIDQPVLRLDQLGRRRLHQRTGRVLRARAEQRRRTGSRTRWQSLSTAPGPTRGFPRSPGRTGLWRPARPTAWPSTHAPALSPKMVTLPGSPPNSAMLSCTQRNASTRSRRYKLLSMVMLAASTATTDPNIPARPADS